MHKIIIVVGTSSDYIQWIRHSCPGRALFITAPGIRETAEEECPSPCEEILIDLSDRFLVFEALKNHLKTWDQVIDGIFCFDCESMVLTAFLAEKLGIEYPSEKTIQNCRDKYAAKKIWKCNDILCPRVSLINNVSDVMAFFHSVNSGCVLKPLTGSGSELVFRCITEFDCHSAFKLIQKGLKNRDGNPMFDKPASQTHLMLAEELIHGTEYSCDFICENNYIQIIRITRKIKSPLMPFGTILGYILPGKLPDFIDLDVFHGILLKSAQVLGIKRGICMVDFIVSGGCIELIELAPRPGGDCLPYLLKDSIGMDILKLSLDFAQKYPLKLNSCETVSTHVGIRLHADKSGILKSIDVHNLTEDTQVKQIILTKKPGHKIILPPEDYDSWLLGDVIIEPSNGQNPESRAISITKMIDIHIDSKKLTYLQEAS